MGTRLQDSSGHPYAPHRRHQLLFLLQGSVQREDEAGCIFLAHLGVLATITFFAQSARDGGPGTWATAFTAIVCFLIAVIAYLRGKGRIKKIDEVSLAGAALAVGLWYYTDNPLSAVLLAIVVGALGFVPTFRKAFDKPQEETAITYLLNGIKFAVAMLALESFTPVTWLYPAALTFLNLSLAAMLFLRRPLYTSAVTKS